MINQIASKNYLFIAAAVGGILLANSSGAPWFNDLAQSHLAIGPINLEIQHWVEDFLLAFFFLNVGFDLKYERVYGLFSSIKQATLPIVAALGGMVVPAILFLSITFTGSYMLGSGSNELWHGWAIPTVTDIAISVAIMDFALKQPHKRLKLFLLALAVADDIFGIVIIAVFYSSSINIRALAVAFIGVFAWWLISRIVANNKQILVFKICSLSIIGLTSWIFMLFSGIHTAIIGVALGLCYAKGKNKHAWEGTLKNLVNRSWLFSTLICLPLFIFFNMRINLWEIISTLLGPIVGLRTTGDSHNPNMPNINPADAPVGPGGEVVGPEVLGPIHFMPSPTTLGLLVVAIIIGLIVGKPLGVYLFTLLTTKIFKLSFSASVSLKDIRAICFLAGIGFTVSFLIASLSFDNPFLGQAAKLAIIIGSIISAIFGFILTKQLSKRRVAASISDDDFDD